MVSCSGAFALYENFCFALSVLVELGFASGIRDFKYKSAPYPFGRVLFNAVRKVHSLGSKNEKGLQLNFCNPLSLFDTPGAIQTRGTRIRKSKKRKF